MITVRQIERLWNAGEYNRILLLCLDMRQERSTRLELWLERSAVAAAAMAVIRLEELQQSHVPLCSRLIRAILSAQESDGGWGEPLFTALSIRALMCGSGHGLAIDRGIQYLANLQKTEGAWPKEAFRRMPADALVSAFILFHLGDDERFVRAVRFDEAIRWFEMNEHGMDADAARLWRAACLRRSFTSAARPAQVWS